MIIMQRRRRARPYRDCWSISGVHILNAGSIYSFAVGFLVNPRQSPGREQEQGRQGGQRSGQGTGQDQENDQTRQKRSA
jgi:hypothetical protein